MGLKRGFEARDTGAQGGSLHSLAEAITKIEGSERLQPPMRAVGIEGAANVGPSDVSAMSKRRLWSDEETERLKTAYMQHKGKWSAMASDPKFGFCIIDKASNKPVRTAADLKDRWRTIHRVRRGDNAPFPAKYIENESMKIDGRGHECLHYLVVPVPEYMSAHWFPEWALKNSAFFPALYEDYQHFKKHGVHLDGNKSREDARLKTLLKPPTPKQKVSRRALRSLPENQAMRDDHNGRDDDAAGSIAHVDGHRLESRGVNGLSNNVKAKDEEITTLQSKIRKSALRRSLGFNESQNEKEFENALEAASKSPMKSSPLTKSGHATQQQPTTPMKSPSTATATAPTISAKKHAVFPVSKTATPSASTSAAQVNAPSQPRLSSSPRVLATAVSPVSSLPVTPLVRKALSVDSKFFQLRCTIKEFATHRVLLAELRRSYDGVILARTTLFKVNIQLLEQQGFDAHQVLEGIPILKDGYQQLYTGGALRETARRKIPELSGDLSAFNHCWVFFNRVEILAQPERSNAMGVSEGGQMVGGTMDGASNQHSVQQLMLKVILVHGSLDVFGTDARAAFFLDVENKNDMMGLGALGFEHYAVKSYYVKIWNENMQPKIPMLDTIVPGVNLTITMLTDG